MNYQGSFGLKAMFTFKPIIYCDYLLYRIFVSMATPLPSVYTVFQMVFAFYDSIFMVFYGFFAIWYVHLTPAEINFNESGLFTLKSPFLDPFLSHS